LDNKPTSLRPKTLLILILIPTLIFSAFFLIRRSIIGLLTVNSACGIVLIIILYLSRKKAPTKIDEKLVSVLIHMYAISHGEVGSDDIVRVIAETEDYGYYSKVFSKIRELARKFGYGFTKATSYMANMVKPPFKDILIRCERVFSSINPKGYLELEASTIVEEYTGYYRRSVELMDMIGSLYSTLQCVSIFLILILDVTIVFTYEPNMIYCSYVIASISLIVMFLGLRAVVPKDAFVYIDRNNPPMIYRMFKLTVPIAFVAATPAILVGLAKGFPYGFIIFGTALLIPGLFAYKLESFVTKVDENYPTLIKCLGENMASSSSLRSALSYVLYMELGPLKNLLKRALARVKIGIKDEKALELISSESASHRVYATNKMFMDAFQYGGDLLEVGKVLGNNCIKFLELRKKRNSVVKSFRIIIFILQPITVALLVILTHLCRFFFQSLTSLPFFTFGEIPISVIEVGNLFMVLFITCLNALTLKEVQGGFWGTSLLYISILLFLSAVGWVCAENVMEFAFGRILEGFKELL